MELYGTQLILDKLKMSQKVHNIMSSLTFTRTPFSNILTTKPNHFFFQPTNSLSRFCLKKPPIVISLKVFAHFNYTTHLFFVFQDINSVSLYF